MALEVIHDVLSASGRIVQIPQTVAALTAANPHDVPPPLEAICRVRDDAGTITRLVFPVLEVIRDGVMIENEHGNHEAMLWFELNFDSVCDIADWLSTNQAALVIKPERVKTQA